MKGINTKMETAQKIVIACAVLNNIALDFKDQVWLTDANFFPAPNIRIPRSFTLPQPNTFSVFNFLHPFFNAAMDLLVMLQYEISNVSSSKCDLLIDMMPLSVMLGRLLAIKCVSHQFGTFTRQSSVSNGHPETLIFSIFFDWLQISKHFPVTFAQRDMSMSYRDGQ